MVFSFFILMSIDVLPACLSVHHVSAWCPLEKGIESHGTGRAANVLH